MSIDNDSVSSTEAVTSVTDNESMYDAIANAESSEAPYQMNTDAWGGGGGGGSKVPPCLEYAALIFIAASSSFGVIIGAGAGVAILLLLLACIPICILVMWKRFSV